MPSELSQKLASPLQEIVIASLTMGLKVKATNTRAEGTLALPKSLRKGFFIIGLLN